MPGHFPHAPTRKLPQQPSLEQLRKQAKELLQQYRNGAAAAIRQIQCFEREPNQLLFPFTTPSACSRVRTDTGAGRN
ncbi:MAG TPA: hypothetical protein VH351_17335 [Bryobacteraceae bacterium]|jgi:hypothetical protein|nr:hypothetical protein [Bryobacteraceae bacterium]